MELISIRQVSLDYGISRQMLYYYEEIGLLKSNRKDNYAYRLYDENAIKRLQQIIILRKLQIPMKQIKDILNNQNAVEVIEIFKQNISELDEHITALSVVRSILTRFIDELQEKADVYLKLDLLNDKTMLAAVEPLSFTKHKIKEKMPMEELNKANEVFNRQADKNVRIVYRPPATMAVISYDDGGAPPEEGKARKEAEAIAKKFIEDIELIKLKPDMRVFGFGDGNDYGDWTIWVTIPDDLDVPAPFEKHSYPGGLYAVCADHDFDRLDKWIKNSDDYEWDGSNRAGGDEYINPFNVYGLKRIDSETAGSMYTEGMIPVKEIPKLTEEENNKLMIALKNFEMSVSTGKTTDIDLTAIEKHGKTILNYENSLLEVKVVDIVKGISTPQRFKFPLKIELRAKTNSEIMIEYATGCLDINWWANRGSLFISDITGTGEYLNYKKSGIIPLNEFIDIEWILGRDVMAVKINGELRHINNEQKYIKKIKENPDLEILSDVKICADINEDIGEIVTITVESLRITEL